MINDVRRAYFYAQATRDLYIELPPEGEQYGQGDLSGKLNLCLYGTRDAALNWQETLSNHLIENGFRRGVGFPSVFHDLGYDTWTLVHGDDYRSAGDDKGLQWLEKTLAEKYEIKTKKVGHADDMSREGQILNRVVRATERGFELEADPRHAELLMEQLGLTDGRTKGVVTPGSDGQDEFNGEAEEHLSPRNATAFRGVAARCNYLSVDRPDALFPVK